MKKLKVYRWYIYDGDKPFQEVDINQDLSTYFPILIFYKKNDPLDQFKSYLNQFPIESIGKVSDNQYQRIYQYYGPKEKNGNAYLNSYQANSDQFVDIKTR